MNRVWGYVLIALMAFAVVPAGTAQDAAYPKLGSLKRSEVNVRAGPGTRYPILWVFQRMGWPVMILAKYDNWYKIRDVEGEEGWTYIGMVSGEQTAIVSTGEPAVLYKKADGSKPLYRLEQGVVVGIEQCGELQCEVSVRGSNGWLSKERLVQLQ